MNDTVDFPGDLRSFTLELMHKRRSELELEMEKLLAAIASLNASSQTTSARRSAPPNSAPVETPDDGSTSKRRKGANKSLVIAYLQSHGPSSVREISSGAGIALSSVNAALTRMGETAFSKDHDTSKWSLAKR